MMRPSFSPTGWKRLVTVLAACMLGLVVGESVHAIGPPGVVDGSAPDPGPGRGVLSLIALVFCLLIGWTRPEEHRYRQLALCFLTLSLNIWYTSDASISDTTFTAGRFISLATFGPTWYFAAGFALAYQPYDTTPLRRLLRDAFPWYLALVAASALYSLWLWLGLGYDTPALSMLVLVSIACGLVLVTASLADGMCQTRGNLRMRHQWLLLAFVCGALGALLSLLASSDVAISDRHYAASASSVCWLLMYAGVGYALSRDRLSDLRALVSQMTVLGGASLLLLALFGLVDHVMHDLFDARLVHTEHDEHHLLNALFMLPALYLLNHVHDSVERSVRGILFQSAQDREQALREFVRRAVHFTSAEALLDALVHAFDRFARGSGTAVYLARDGGFFLAVSSLEGVSPALDLDPEARAKLESNAASCGHAGTSPEGDLTLPMCHRNALHGVVLVGRRIRGNAYRPDEIAVLVDAAHQIALDLDTLHVDALEASIDALTLEGELQEFELRFVAGRRQAARVEFSHVAREAPWAEGAA